MAVSVQKRADKFQLRVTDKLLQKPFIHTFDSEQVARDYGAQLRALLKRGIVPSELLPEPNRKQSDPLIDQIVSAYLSANAMAPSTDKLAALVREEIAGLRLSTLTYEWVEGYIAKLKLDHHKPLAPGSIRKRISLLSRVMDWHIARSTPKGETPAANVFKMLPRGYSSYSRHEAKALEGKGLKARRDNARNLRLHPGDEQRILGVLDGAHAFDQERSRLAYGDPAFRMLYLTIVDTGMRLFEAYRLRVEAIDFERRLIHVDGSKGWGGNIKPRIVPIKTALLEPLRAFCEGRSGFVFPYWDGTEDARKVVTSLLSNRFQKLFGRAGLPNFREHDLRHEATCRWVELRDARGGWLFSDVEICRIMGWTNTKMMLRYASLRGEDLADRLKQI